MQRIKEEIIVKWKMDLFLMIKFLFQGWPLITLKFWKDSLDAKRAIYLTIKTLFKERLVVAEKIDERLFKSF